MTQIVPMKRRAPGPLPTWPQDSLDKQTSLRACLREIDRAMTFPPDAAQAARVAELSVRAATLLLNMRGETDALAQQLAKAAALGAHSKANAQ